MSREIIKYDINHREFIRNPEKVSIRYFQELQEGYRISSEYRKAIEMMLDTRTNPSRKR